MGLLGDIVDTVTSPVRDAWHTVEHAASSTVHWLGDAASGAVSWVGAHWKQIVVIGTAVVVGTIVTVATGGAGAPLLVALAAGGFAGGASADVVNSLLKGQSPDLLHALRAGAISSLISVGTFGLGKLATPLISRAITPAASRALASAADSLPGIVPAADETATSAAGSTLAGLDAGTLKTLEQYGLTPDSTLYRVADPKYVDLANGEVAGNPNSIAIVQDPYAPLVEHPLSVAGRAENPDLPPLLVPQQRLARELGPTLNVSTRDPSGYAAPGYVKLQLGVGDLLASGGRIYKDVSANLSDSFIVTVPDRVPIQAVSAPTGQTLDGLPLPATTGTSSVSIDKVETYVRGALKTGASAGRAVTSGTTSDPGPRAPDPEPSWTKGILGGLTRLPSR